MPISEDCLATQNLTFIAQECEARKFLDRLNKIEYTFCQIERRIEIANAKIIRDCPNRPSSSSAPSSSSSSSFTCALRCAPSVPERITYLVKNSTLNEAAYVALQLLEDEVCDTLRQLVSLELAAETGCSTPSESSSSADPGPDPSSSSSVPPSSSSSSAVPSSSSSSFGDCLDAGLIMVGLYCPEAPEVGLQFINAETPDEELYGECYWRTPEETTPSLYVYTSSDMSYSTGLGINTGLPVSDGSTTVLELFPAGFFGGHPAYSTTGVFQLDPYSQPSGFAQVYRVGPNLHAVITGPGGYSEFENTDPNFPVPGGSWDAVNLETDPSHLYINNTLVIASSSSVSGSSSSSSLPPNLFSEIRYNLSLNRWEWANEDGVIAIRITPDYTNPTGEYVYLDEACEDYSITLVIA